MTKNPTLALTPDASGAIDVRVLVPIERHKLLLKMFAELPQGAHFIFINDHDPLPLCYEFRSIHGDVVGWEYLQRGGTDWKVKVTRTAASRGREFEGASTLMDMRRIAEQDWKHAIFHRYGMMEEGHSMLLLAAENPHLLQQTFEDKFAGQHSWQVVKDSPEEYVVRITKQPRSSGSKPPQSGQEPRLVADIDLRPYPPAERHERFFQAFAELQANEAFAFTNDHDPKPLYYQIEAESQHPFSWVYLASGPEVWRVQVTRNG